MALAKKIEAIRNDSTLSEQERLWKALAVIAKRIDDDEDLDVVGAIFGAG
jgi:hypothetical protein